MVLITIAATGAGLIVNKQKGSVYYTRVFVDIHGFGYKLAK